MGKQIQITLSEEDEEALINYLKTKFSVEVANASYPKDWNKQELYKTSESKNWIIYDTRTTEILLENINTCYPPVDFSKGLFSEEDRGPIISWNIRSSNQSCIDWNRDLYHKGQIPSPGRLYLDTSPDDIYMDISAETGDDIGKLFKAACSWVRKNCINTSENKRGKWVSQKLKGTG